MKIKLNDHEYVIDENETLQSFLQKQALPHQGFAVAVNKKFVARAHYGTTQLQEHDHVQIMMPMQGG